MINVPVHKKTVFVTGASGFIGSCITRSLLRQGYKVRAGVHRTTNNLQNNPNLEIIEIDICDINSLTHAFQGVDYLYHFAASVNIRLPAAELYEVNTEGTKNIWLTARDAGVRKALYCSTTAVYGLLSKNGKAISEAQPPCAVEPYGRSKLEGEWVVKNISEASNLISIIIRPTAVFGPNEHTDFGKSLKKAAYSKLLFSGGFKNKKFSYIHVEDVAGSAIHLMANSNETCNVYNIAIDKAITYEQAFKSYMNALAKMGLRNSMPRVLGKLSMVMEQMPLLKHPLNSAKRSPFVFPIWKPGFDMTYSAQKLLTTSYKFIWNNFEDVIASCLKTVK